MRRSLDAIGFDVSLADSKLATIIEHVVSTNAQLISAESDLGVIVFVTAGLNPTYVGVEAAAEAGCSIGVHTFELPFQLWADGMRNGRRLATPDAPHMPANVIDPRIKTRSRMAFILADKQARQIDPKARALLLDSHGSVTETGTCNLFIVKHGQLQTPPGESVLQGISRHVVMNELAGRVGVECVESEFQAQDVLDADEAFTTSTPYCLMPVSHLNGSSLGSEIPGSVTGSLTRAWSEMVDVDIVEQICRS